MIWFEGFLDVLSVVFYVCWYSTDAWYWRGILCFGGVRASFTTWSFGMCTYFMCVTWGRARSVSWGLR